MAQPVLVLVQLNNVHDGLTSGLIVFGLGNSGSSDDVIPSLEVGVGQLVGAEQMNGRIGQKRGVYSQSSAADCDSGKDTVALVLVHDKARLNTLHSFL